MDQTSAVEQWMLEVFTVKQSQGKVNVPQRFEGLPCGCRRRGPEAMGDERTVWHLKHAEGDSSCVVHVQCGMVVLRLPRAEAASRRQGYACLDSGAW